MLGITEAEPPVTALDGKVLVVCPGSARAPQVGMVCPWTALTYGEFLQIRERGIVNNEGEQVMPPFEAWGTTNESGTGRAVIHFEVPAMLEYLREWNRVAAARRAARREGEGKLAVVSRQSSDIPCNFPLPTAN